MILFFKQCNKKDMLSKRVLQKMHQIDKYVNKYLVCDQNDVFFTKKCSKKRCSANKSYKKCIVCIHFGKREQIGGLPE